MTEKQALGFQPASRLEYVGDEHHEKCRIAGIIRNVFQDCDGGFRPRIMYLETVDWATSNPSISSSPWILGAPVLSENFIRPGFAGEAESLHHQATTLRQIGQN